MPAALPVQERTEWHFLIIRAICPYYKGAALLYRKCETFLRPCDVHVRRMSGKLLRELHLSGKLFAGIELQNGRGFVLQRNICAIPRNANCLQ